MSLRVHGGPDGDSPAAFDFSTNANACGPCPAALAAVRAADVRSYPDPQYRALRERLAARHGVAPRRILPAASASEAIQRITARAAQRGLRQVSLPALAYGDYRHAADAWSLPVTARAPGRESGPSALPALAWACDPSSPLGQGEGPSALQGAGMAVLDCAYAPLRLAGASAWTPAALDAVWQLWTPNKALGMTGVRAAYLVAPAGAAQEAAALERLAPSWPIGSHGVALLDAWCLPAVQSWLADSLHTLRGWKSLQQRLLLQRGWQCLPSEANFFVARPPLHAPPDLPGRLRAAGVQVRDCASFGLPAHLRLGVLAPPAQQALARALDAAAAPATTMHAPPP